MCWGTPGKVVEVNGMYAKVSVGGTVVDALLSVDDVKVGDYVIVHAGLVVGKLSEEEFVSNLALLAELQVSNYVSEGIDEGLARDMVVKDLARTLSSLGINPDKYVETLRSLAKVSEVGISHPNAVVKVPPNAYTYSLRTTLSDTDYLQVVHYTNYFRFCERAWSELLSNLGFSYSKLIHEYGVFIPTTEASSRLFTPSRLDNELKIYIWVESVTTKSVRWRCVIENVTSGKVCADLTHVAVCTDTALTQSLELPKELVEALRKFLSTSETRSSELESS